MLFMQKLVHLMTGGVYLNLYNDIVIEQISKLQGRRLLEELKVVYKTDTPSILPRF